MDKQHDVIISGAGPSGSLIGYLLALKGIDTLILEKENFPRKKICAGGLQYRTVKLLPFSVNEVIDRKIHGIYFSFKSNNIFNRKYPVPIIYTTKRSVFDNYLANKAIGTGWRNGLAFKEIEVVNDELGKPDIKLSGKAQEFFSEKKLSSIHLSITHLKDIASANSIYELIYLSC